MPQEAADDELLLADSLEDYRHTAVTAFSAESGSYETAERYLTLVNSAAESVKLKKQVEILRFEPSFKFTSDTIRKRVVEDILFPILPRPIWKFKQLGIYKLSNLEFFHYGR